MSPMKRSALMARIKGRDTKIEKMLASALSRLGIKWKSHLSSLPGRPDFVIDDVKVIVFVDGDFWHGWRFPAWRHKLTPRWESKIAANRRRDSRNHRKLRAMGWKVVRIWEHQIERDLESCLSRIL